MHIILLFFYYIIFFVNYCYGNLKKNEYLINICYCGYLRSLATKNFWQSFINNKTIQNNNLCYVLNKMRNPSSLDYDYIDTEDIKTIIKKTIEIYDLYVDIINNAVLNDEEKKYIETIKENTQKTIIKNIINLWGIGKKINEFLFENQSKKRNLKESFLNTVSFFNIKESLIKTYTTLDKTSQKIHKEIITKEIEFYKLLQTMWDIIENARIEEYKKSYNELTKNYYAIYNELPHKINTLEHLPYTL